MTTTQSRFFDELAKLMSNAAGAAQGVRREVDALVQAQVERVVHNLELVKRDDFEVVKAMAAKALDESDALRRRLATLESRLASPGSADSASDSRAD